MRGTRLIVAMLTALLALGCGIAWGAQDESNGTTNDPSLSAPPSAEPGPEVIADRTATSQTFRLPDGKLETRIFANPINYRDEEGKWQPIEEGFEEAEGSSLTNGANEFEVSLPQQMDEGPVRLTSEEGWVSSQLTGTPTETVEVSGNTASYEGAQGDVEFDLQTVADGIKEDIELADPSSPHVFTYELSAAAGLVPSKEEDGSIVFRNDEGEAVVTLPAPVIEDSSPNPSPSGAVHYELQAQEGNRWQLTVEADPEWLADPARTFPVRIDPPMTVPAPELDCNIGGKKGESGWGLCGSGGRKELLLAYKPQLESSKDEWARALLRYNFKSVPVDAYILSANFNANASTEAVNTSGVELAQLTQTKWAKEANWKRYAIDAHSGADLLWTNEGGDYSTVLGKTLTSERGTKAGWWAIPLPQGAIEESEPHGPLNSKGEPKYGPALNFIAKLIDDKVRECSSSCTQRSLTLESSAAPNSENRPFVSLVYYAEAAKESKLTRPLEGTVTSRRLKLQSALGAGVKAVTYQFREGKTGRFETIPTGLVKNAEGKEVKWPIALGEGETKTEPLYFDAAHATPTLRAKGGAIQVRALFDGLGAGYSVPVNATVNRFVGGPRDEAVSIGPGSVNLITGNLVVSRTDVSIPGWGGLTLAFSRTHNSRDAASGSESVLGAGWKPGVPVEKEGGAQWRSVREFVPSAEEVEEGLEPYALLVDLKGNEYAFEKTGETWVTPPELTGTALTKESGVFVYTDSAGNRTFFGSSNSNGEYLPTKITQTGGSANSTQMVYELEPGKLRLKAIIAPTAAGITCNELTLGNIGCRSLSFNYSTGHEGEPPKGRLTSITYSGPEYALNPHTGLFEMQTVSRTAAKYEYDKEGRLVAEWDPRVSPALKETYAYESGGQLKTITPPGQEPWTMEYGTADEEEANGRLMNVKRASLASPSTAQTTIAYGVPLSGVGLPDMSSAAVAKWGQKDLPTDATAIFPPNEIPGSPPSSYASATIYYLDVEGGAVNIASPAGAGTTEPAITTMETDEFGNIVRKLSPQNRVRVLEATEEKRKERWEELETKRRYDAEGTQMEEEWGPTHLTRIADTGETRKARLHTIVLYKDKEEGWSGSGLNPHLPTKAITGADIPGEVEDADRRATETKYNWTLLQPTETIVDSEPGGLKLTTRVAYDENGLPIESSLPAGPKGSNPHTTKTIYYTAGTNAQDASCGNSPGYANLPCKVMLAKQPEGKVLPEVLATRYPSYNALSEPLETIESPGGKEETTRKVVVTYDEAGRETSHQIVGGGTTVPKVQTTYSPTLGLPISKRFVCEGECVGGSPQFSLAFGKEGSGEGQLNGPRGVAADGKGHVWVVDRVNNRVEEFNQQGEYLGQFGKTGTGNGQFTNPWGIAVTPSGNLWVADTGNTRLEEFNAKGEFIQKFGTKASSGSKGTEFIEPQGVASAPGGMLWVSDDAGKRLGEFRESVTSESERWVRNTSGVTLSEPIGVAVDASSNVWLTDEGNDRLYEFSPEGALTRTVGTFGSGNGQLNNPTGVAIAPSGNVVVADLGNNRIEEFSSGGTFLYKFGTSGSGSENFSGPKGIAFGVNNWAFIADKGNNQIKKWKIDPSTDSQETVTGYDALGRPVEYLDADGNVSTVTYDVDSRPVSTTDGKGTQTRYYDATSGLLTKLEDSAAGTFTAAYNADGAMTEKGLPNGLVAKTTYNEAGEPTNLTYTKVTSCTEKCTWLEESQERSIYGEVLSQTSLSSSQQYSYDKAGRLKLVKDTPTGGGCTTRQYAYDADSNRTQLTTRAPGGGGACDTSSEGTVQKYSYDEADRLTDEGIKYDSFGRITSLLAKDAGGSTLETTFYSNEMPAIQSQNGITNSYQLDAAGRPRELKVTGSKEATEVFHYAGGADSPAWTAKGSEWTRNIGGIGGELAAIQPSSGETSLQLANLHGDIAAVAPLSSTKLSATYEFDEFGNPKSGTAGRYGWLGGKQRRTELPSGVIQMGVRSYVPALGRFISRDPVPGGSLNSYEYAGQEPITQFDLSGCSFAKFVGCIANCISRYCHAHNATINFSKFEHCLASMKSIAGLVTCVSHFCELKKLAVCGAGCVLKDPPFGGPAPDPEKPLGEQILETLKRWEHMPLPILG
jgi:RHS repeat-associated protein